MAEKNNATCSICGSEYHVCLFCKDKMELHPYKVYCCSPSHFQVFQVVRGFSTGVYDKDEFKSKLLNIDLSDLEDYRGHIKALIKDALKEDVVKTVENVKTVERNETVEEVEDKIEKTVVENIAEVKVEETKIAENIVNPTVSRKRNFKVENE